MQNKKECRHIIKKIVHDSIAEELELLPGDEILRINGKKVKDIFDYHYFTQEEELTLLVKKVNGEEWEVSLEKDETEDLGIEFEAGLMDDYKSCRNKCIFCFIDQNPPNMRDTIYFKDDDARLSFLQGNYITLTNMSEEDVERICFYKLSPINISVHTMNPELRCKMLNNRFAGDALRHLQRFYEAGLTMNGQIVLCKDYNDRKELDDTIQQLIRFLPLMQSVSIVPIGITKYRKGLAELKKFNREDSIYLINQVESWQKKLLKKYGTRFVFASDEWYLTAKQEVPEEDSYEGYPQIENGVGSVRSLLEEVSTTIRFLHGVSVQKNRTVSIATGVLAAPIMEQLTNQITNRFPQVQVKVYSIINYFFGETITVAGLLTGQDIIKQLSGQILGEELLLSSVMIRSQEDVFLDDLHVKDVENALQTKIRIVKSDGDSFVHAVLGC